MCLRFFLSLFPVRDLFLTNMLGEAVKKTYFLADMSVNAFSSPPKKKFLDIQILRRLLVLVIWPHKYIFEASIRDNTQKNVRKKYVPWWGKAGLVVEPSKTLLLW